MQVPFESYTSVYKTENLLISKLSPKCFTFLDGLSNAKEYENGVYLYRYLKPESESK